MAQPQPQAQTGTSPAVPASGQTLALAAPASAPGLDPLDRARCRPPRLGQGLIARPRLVRRLAESHRASLAVLVAPAGYGKTTLVSEWARHDERPFAWVSLGPDDNDPAQLLAHVSCALDPFVPDRLDPLRALSLMPAVVLVLDDVQVLREPAALATLDALRQVLPPASQLALASRSEPVLALGRLRAHGGTVELRLRDLAMSSTEATSLFAAAGVRLDPGEAGVVVRRTEGWPAALYLAALAKGDEPSAGIDCFAGNDRHMEDYLREEFLAHLSNATMTFITRTSVLEALSGPLCDAVLGSRDSGAVLSALARSDLPLAPLDRSGDWFRYHGLLREMLRAELLRREPESEADLHRQASAWFDEHNDVDRAIEHAVQAHDVERAGALMWRNAGRSTGRREAAVHRWLGHFTDTEIARSPSLVLVAAYARLAAGDGYGAERWASLAAVSREHVSPEDLDPSLEGGMAAIRAAMGRQGIGAMAEDAARAYSLAAGDSPWRPICRLVEGVAAHLSGDHGQARKHLEEAMRHAAVQSPGTHALCLAQLSLLAEDEDDPESSAWLAARAKGLVARPSGPPDAPTVALVYAVSAASRANRGHVEEAREDRRVAAALLGGLRDFAGWYECEARVVLARAALAMNDSASARKLLTDASQALRQVPDPGVLPEWIAEAWARSEGGAVSGPAEGWSLTDAELRVLQFLPSHLSFREIATRLYVSPNTIKTHVRAVYRKLDASSRGQAVQQADRAGLLDSGAWRTRAGL